MEPETTEPVSEVPAEPPTPLAPEPVLPPESAEPKRGRGRPAGSKNKPKITVVPLQAPPPDPEPSPGEEADTEEAPAPKPKPKAQPKVITKVVRMPEPPATTPQETFRMAMEAISHMARADKQSRQARYDTLVSRMVK
jgi:hypothetical protein